MLNSGSLLDRGVWWGIPEETSETKNNGLNEPIKLKPRRMPVPPGRLNRLCNAKT